MALGRSFGAGEACVRAGPWGASRSDCPGALRPSSGGRPLPAAGGRRTRCRARPTKPVYRSRVGRRSTGSSRSKHPVLRPLVTEGTTREASALWDASSQLQPRSAGRRSAWRPGLLLRTYGNRRALPDQKLLDLHLGAGFFELLLCSFGVGLRNRFLDRLRGAVDEVLRLLEAEARELAHRLDDVDLVFAGREQHDGELGLLFGSGGGGCSGGAGSGNRGGGGHAELVFHRLDELGQLEHRHRSDLVENFSLDS